MKIIKYENLECWQNARKVANQIYALSIKIKCKADYNLVNQMRSASISIMANIAEGYGRRGDKEFKQFLYIAKSSASELQSHLYIALDQAYLDKVQFANLYDQLEIIQRQICNFIKYLNQ